MRRSLIALSIALSAPLHAAGIAQPVPIMPPPVAAVQKLLQHPQPARWYVAVTYHVGAPHVVTVYGPWQESAKGREKGEWLCKYITDQPSDVMCRVEPVHPVPALLTGGKKTKKH